MLAFCQADVDGRQDGEDVCLKECDQALEAIHCNQEQEPDECDDAHAQSGSKACGDDLGGVEHEDLAQDGKDAEDHVACEHVAVESNSQGQKTNDQGDELKEPDDGDHRNGKTVRGDGLNVAEAALG